MKKILLAFGGPRFSEGIFQFAKWLNEKQPVLLIGVFLPEVVYSNIYAFGSGLPAADFVPFVGQEDNQLIEKNMNHFTDLCERNGISYRVHKDYDNLALSELKKETRFADLLIISSEKFYTTYGLNDLNPSLTEALHTSECPIVVVPETFYFPERNILAYDGSESSVFAIKQFAYLFPELAQNETLLVYAKENTDPGLPDESYIEELATQHFKNLNLLKLHLNPRKFFNTWLSERQNVILVGGSFGRSPASELFQKSFVAKVIAEQKLPVFIAHQ